MSAFDSPHGREVLEETTVNKILEMLEPSLRSIVHKAVSEGVVHGDHTNATPHRPKAGGRCAAVWDQLDAMKLSSGVVPELQSILKIGKRKKWNANNTRVEYYAWRKANGVVGRIAN